MPGTARSSVYFPAPVVFSAASTMAVRLPITEKPLAGGSFVVGRLSFAMLFHYRHSSSLGLNSRLDGLVHLVVAGTAAQIAAQRLLDFRFRRMRIVGQQVFHGHYETGSAVAALGAAPISIRLLNGGQTAMLAHPFHCGDLLLLATGGQQRARQHGNAVHLHRAGAAGGVVAAALRARKAQVLAQCVKQQLAGLRRQLVSATVDAKRNEFFFHVFAIST